MRERHTRREQHPRPPDPLARLFLEVCGEPPDDASLLRMRRVSAALNLRDNDALWSVLAALEYYVRLYEAMPERIRQAGTGGVDAAHAEAQAATQALMVQHRDALARCVQTGDIADRCARTWLTLPGTKTPGPDHALERKRHHEPQTGICSSGQSAHAHDHRTVRAL
jgi:hypothetical protein